MTRNTKKKLAIFAGTSKCLIYAEAKYCASEMPGEIKYYECSRTEYCCGIGCCVSPGLPFHHLWYYWILVIIMFLVCSGGGWWYRYWLQGRYRAAASAIPPRASNPRSQASVRGPTCQGQRARITYNSARNTVLLHRMWKGPQRNGAAPAYNGNATTSAHYQNMSVVLNDANCPYYQLYGPPPSYETVIAQTRGKISNPASPETTNANANTRTNTQSSHIATANPNVAQCFSYACNFATRLSNNVGESIEYPNGGTSSSGQPEDREGIPFAHFSQYCTITDRRNVCVPFAYREQAFVPRDSFNRTYQANSTNFVSYPMDKSSDAENHGYQVPNTEKYTTVNVDCTAGSSREQGVWCRVEEDRMEKDRDTLEATSTTGFPRFFKIEENEKENAADSKSTVNSLEDFFSELRKSRRVYGGSLRASGRYAGKRRGEERSVERGFCKIVPRSCDRLIVDTEAAAASVDHLSRDESSLEDRDKVSANSSQSNPSNNVILVECLLPNGAPCSSSTGNVEKSCSRLVNASTNSDLESKHRLDRSKSLD